MSSVYSLDPVTRPRDLRWIPLRRHFGITAYGVNAYIAQSLGQVVVEPHTEAVNGHEELYMVLAGRAVFQLDDEELEAPVGTAIFVGDPSVERSASAGEAGTTVLAIGGVPGAHEISPWEYAFQAYAYHAAGETQRAVNLLREALDERGELPGLHYDLACMESLSGQRAEALAHLCSAVELDERYRELARNDTDLDQIRDAGEFPA